MLQVEGMSCSGCEQRLGTVLRRVEGVRGVVADHTCGRVEVRVDPAVTDRTVLVERIEAAGYRVAEEVSR
ncbi:heavy-metal-associated domain-containing protein [Prauserella sp. PE36]|uniref:heavy-metal-associated domain-containing protein n=1 Tax=Prauserella sp. PE36 TaxID=1504709 RepID=UPI001F3C2703|nr:heavy-metal-associated domain-containing protein [Prauserella sp. PE36]